MTARQQAFDDIGRDHQVHAPELNFVRAILLRAFYDAALKTNDKREILVSALVARPVALAAAGRPRHRPRHLLSARRGRVRAWADAARAKPDRTASTARSQFRLAASAGHRDRGRDRGPRPPAGHPSGPAVWRAGTDRRRPLRA